MGSYVELLKACKEGNSKKVKKLLGTCKNIADVRDLTDKTLLHYCFQNESCTDLILEIAPELLNVGEKAGYTVLHLASMMKPPTPLQYLLSKDPEINKKTNELRTPLLLAVIYDNYEAAKILCEANAEVNVTDCLGVSPLHYAAKSKSEKDVEQQVKIIDLLLEFKAKIEFLDSFQRTPLIWAVSSNNLVKMRHLIVKGADINAKDVSGLSILHYATSNGNLDIIESLLSEYSFPIETVDNNQCTALMYACTMNQRSVVQSLINHGANVNAEDTKRRTAVHFACGKGDLDIVRILAEHNADLWKSNEDLTFPLHEASFKGHSDIVRFFMSHGDDENRLADLINRKNANGQTSLHLAAVKDHLDICRILLENGADPNIQLRASNGKSMTALDLANCTATKELIIRYNGKTTDELTSMCPITEENTYSISEQSETEFSQESSDNCDVMSEKSDFDNLKEEQSQQETVDKEKIEHLEESLKKEDKVEIELTEMLRKFLLDSCYKNNIEVIKEYAARGVCLSDIVDDTGKNLLHYSMKNRDTFALVMSLAPDCVNRCDNARLSVLNLTVMSKDNDCLDLLLANKADYNFVDDADRSCVHLAVIYNNLPALALIGRHVEEVGGSIIHGPDHAGNYPLHYSVELYRSGTGTDPELCQQFIESLLTMGGDIECRDRVARTPLLLAVNTNNMAAVVQLLGHGADVLARDQHCLCSVHYACSEGHWPIFELLAARPKFDPDIKDQNGLTPIFYAVASCNDRIVQRLIELRASVDVTDRYGRNLCHKASEKGAFKCLELLLDRGVDPWLRSNDGTLPLHEAAYRGYKEVAEILLGTRTADENVNVKNVSGQTALHLAAVRNDCPMCFLLINKGASVNELLYDGGGDCMVTAYDLATTPYCRETLHTFGGRPARRLCMDNDDDGDDGRQGAYNDDNCAGGVDLEDLEMRRLHEMLEETSLIGGPPYSVRSTELALSTLPPSVMAPTSRTVDRTSRTSPSRTNGRLQTHTIRSPVSRPTSSKCISPPTSSSRQPDTNPDRNIPEDVLLISEPSPEDVPPSSASRRTATTTATTATTASTRTPSTVINNTATSTSAKTLSRKSSSRPTKTHRNNRRQQSLPSSSSDVINHRIQDRIQSSICNYEFIRLDSRIACQLARQKIRKENVDKLINPKTPKLLRRVKAST